MQVRAWLILAVAAMTVLSSIFGTPGRPNELRACSAIGPGEFVISYSQTTYTIDDQEPVSAWMFQLLSNGTCYLNYTVNPFPGVTDSTGNVSWQLAKSTFDSILLEWSPDILRYNRDLGSPAKVEETALSVEWYNSNLSAVFEGHSMMGLMPRSFAAINNVCDLMWRDLEEPLNVTLDVSAVQGEGDSFVLTASLENGEEFLLYQSSTCTESWPLWIVRVNGNLARNLQTSAPMCIIDFYPGTVTVFDAKEWIWTGAAPGLYVVMVRLVVYEYVFIQVPDTSGAVNRAPVALFTVTPSDGDRDTVFEFDAIMSADWEDNSSVLEIRWDWDDDRRWDLEWSLSRSASHQFFEDGKHVVTMQVRDSTGLINETTLTITVGEDTDLLLVALGVTIVVVAAATVFIMLRRGSREPA